MTEFSLPQSELAFRQSMLDLKLDSQVGQIHPRISDESQRYTVGDHAAARLTYRQIIERKYPLPEGVRFLPTAERCTDPEVTCTLTEGHLVAIDDYLRTGQCKGAPQVLAGVPVHELSAVARSFGYDDEEVRTPNVEGYGWHRALWVPHSPTAASVVFMPWMQPWNEEGSPAPIIYTLGNPPIDQVRTLAASYAAFETSRSAVA
jgi:hypothetical protein